MIYLIAIGLSITHIQALAKCSSCKTVPRETNPQVLDMDFLMDFHLPVGRGPAEDEYGATGPGQVSNPCHSSWQSFRFKHITVEPKPCFGANPNPTNGRIDRLKLFGAEERTVQRGSLSIPEQNRLQNPRTFSKHVLTQHIHHEKYFPRVPKTEEQPPSGNKHAKAKRFFYSKRLLHRPERKPFDDGRFGKLTWTPWQQPRGHFSNMRKREITNRGIKLSDILSRAGFRKDKDEAIKIVLPLLLSDLKETPSKTSNPLVITNVERIHSPVSASTNGSSGAKMRSFKVKGDDGREFSFSAAAADVQQLVEILSKPNSSVMVERVTLEKNRLPSRVQSERTCSPGNKKMSTIPMRPKDYNAESSGNRRQSRMNQQNPRSSPFSTNRNHPCNGRIGAEKFRGPTGPHEASFTNISDFLKIFFKQKWR